MDKDSRSNGGTYKGVVQLPAIPFHSYVAESQAALPFAGGDGILLRQEPEAGVEFFTFDGAYVERLRAGDPSTEEHFVAYFVKLLRIKLRSRWLASDVVDDLSQETLARVVAKVREDGGVRQPDRFGAFVNSIL